MARRSEDGVSEVTELPVKGNSGDVTAVEAALAQELDATVEIPEDVATELPAGNMTVIYASVRQALVERYQAMRLQARLNRKVSNDAQVQGFEDEAKKVLRMIVELDRERTELLHTA